MILLLINNYMINKNIKGTNIELTNAISNYIEKCLDNIKKFIKDDQLMIVQIEVGKTTNHHRSGDIFKAEYNIEISGKKFYSVSEKADLYIAIDDAKDELIRQIKNDKDRKITLYKRGALSVKKMLKGISKRNPFTSKY
jgi:ribosomal subunit interface protein